MFTTNKSEPDTCECILVVHSVDDEKIVGHLHHPKTNSNGPVLRLTGNAVLGMMEEGTPVKFAS